VHLRRCRTKPAGFIGWAAYGTRSITIHAWPGVTPVALISVLVHEITHLSGIRDHRLDFAARMATIIREAFGDAAGIAELISGQAAWRRVEAAFARQLGREHPEWLRPLTAEAVGKEETASPGLVQVAARSAARFDVGIGVAHLTAHQRAVLRVALGELVFHGERLYRVERADPASVGMANATSIVVLRLIEGDVHGTPLTALRRYGGAS